ncbi:putative transcription factor bHLH family [Helianthus annuus]|uniref:Putative myc-type, basic helix-loop-helix (BHLH) domain, Transcription factor MYC/MYB N-terminal n=1 Tax=Helianthus annuus TaxID=4232 RepID=A0A251U4C2_HELAN|nr:transcription factor EMB1444 [Helianthus annuus]KAF5794499.1 putative transcription factor bHLH family [Helianthus annuus]KAJ0552751.1 putative transcription factor bHLH family [Helianthus annuus]KAJ0721677.1 putative transcription factor bHLH family [Helianthus annuus]KAJ0896919.1 putative transcription factor bHLH family [Helianthus annuus]KAJ0900795.1 putative transcription factor bHLH family [Helianthus annuus]
MMGGGGELHQQLRNLCFNTDWKYAVFWKLKHQPQMMLSWDDAYCNDKEKNDCSEINNRFTNANDNLKDEWYPQDHLGLAIANMSYRVYSIGEGAVGRVAATGKHQWISGLQLVNSLCSIDEHSDGWKSQFIAGIRTIVFVAVGSYGVVQLGSLKTITEDLKLVNHIREIFFELHDPSPCVTEISTSSGSVRFHKHVRDQDRTVDKWTKVETITDRQENENPISDLVQSTTCNDQSWGEFMPTISNSGMLNNPETETNNSFKFPAGCELYEALGPTFYKQNDCFDWETVTTETLTVDQTAGDTRSTHSQRSGSENLLEAVVASVCCSDSDTKWSKSSGQPVVKPLSRLQQTPSDLQTSGSICYSFERSLQGFSSASVSRCSEQINRPREPAKAGKKRARPGESGKPRPRDRQLIQDRIKELRQLVPNGSKCSIDSLLERTIKHMLFMQCITKHADKIDKCAEYKLLGSQEQGSSWAMEVGNELKLCPIIVENIGTEGQMLVEMVCDEGVNFLEITEAVRSLGLTIIKGAIDAYGDKTWMCFIVEGENNRSIHRMDILWSLVQILELKTKN